ncbi:Cilia- and flagella-associated protein 100 [Trichoplax sp. H2]|nr:Cilia- and flagella-associated protein 100 [Trichoplax sp. H2]|eukprot:RDD47148.1 Cilia- and flagella-associated protein 100 [Trichoplax sp. H2]
MPGDDEHGHADSRLSELTRATSQRLSRQESSRQSGRVTFPTTIASKSEISEPISINDEDSQEKELHRNPFKIPADNDIFILRDKDKQRRRAERAKQKELKIYEKTTYVQRMNTKKVSSRKANLLPNNFDGANEESMTVTIQPDTQLTLAASKADRHIEKETLKEYIGKKRDMFLVQYSLSVKRDEMRKLEEIAQAEEKELEIAEQHLEEDAAMFDEFLKENDKNSVEAIKTAEAETKAKLEKNNEIKKINSQMMAIRSEITKNDEMLKEYQLYKKFLDALTPQDFRERKYVEKEAKQIQARKDKQTLTKTRKSIIRGNRSSSIASDRSSRLSSAATPKVVPVPLSPLPTSNRHIRTPVSADTDSQNSLSTHEDSDNEDIDSEPDLFFTDPQQLLDIFSELEEQNLSLIQNSQETEEALEEMKQQVAQTKRKMEKETEQLKQQIDFLTISIRKEEERAQELELRSKIFNFGAFQAEDQERMLGALNRKVEEVYRHCIGDNEANLNTLQMLTAIENKLEELFESIELLPSDKVEAAEKAKEKERRLKLREEKLEAQRLHQEDRVKRALKRAQADIKKKSGKPLMYRSEPPQTRRIRQEASRNQDREDEELAYYFSP